MTFYSSDIPSKEDQTNSVSAPSAAVQRQTRRKSFYRQRGKRLLDLALVIATAPFTVPVIAMLALAVLATGQSPFYVQKRLGLDGKIFRMWKLRTMLPNADQRLEDHLARNPAARAEWDKRQKLTNDPRITPIGNWLRKTSMDELPQLFNVLNGSMSLVGPRPMMIEQQEQYHGTGYYAVRPGMTGLWQVSDRNGENCEFVGRVRFDNIYNRTLSFGTDVSVLAKTVVVVLRGTGI